MAHMRPAAAIWLLGAVVYLVCEAIAAVGVSGYSYAADYISDLGVQSVMNVGAFIVHGSLFLLGALVISRGRPTSRRVRRGFVLAAAANAIGNVLVGTFPSGSEHANVHVLGAAMAIVGGNVAAIVAGLGGRAFGATPAFRGASIGLGVTGIACLTVLIIDGANGSRLLPAGLVERGAVYPIIAWELLAGTAILRRGAGCPEAVSLRTPIR
ncbi:DUF998 domain-containing protein [Mycobacterium sp. ITM-2017-0098]|nr:DUF998 domain-containing protein [Mycobacterium sp. ITM-2017-0098]